MSARADLARNISVMVGRKDDRIAEVLGVLNGFEIGSGDHGGADSKVIGSEQTPRLVRAEPGPAIGDRCPDNRRCRVAVGGFAAILG